MSVSISLPNRHFVRHYVEMVVVMMLGMLVLGAPVVAALAGAGASMDELTADAPAALLLGMAVTMTAPMIAWMMWRGHSTRANVEMAAAMFLPTFGVIALLAAGVMTDFGDLMMLEHVVMPAAMLVAMFARRDEYEQH